MKPKNKLLSFLKEYSIITFGTLLVAIGVHFFKFPNEISTGGVTGIAVVFNQIIPFLTASNIVSILNALFLVLGFIFLGKEFGIKTVYCSLMLSAMLEVMDVVVPMTKPMTSEPVLELCYAVFFPAAGAAVLFFNGASSGGTDILAMIIRKYTKMESGKALLVADILFVLLTFYNFESKSFVPQTGLLSVLGLATKSLVVDNMLESFNQSKKILVITSHKEEIENFITKEVRRGATSWECEGSYGHSRSFAIVTVMSRYQAFTLRAYIKKVDPNAFLMITTTSEIIGKGFRTID